ncbi:MAG: hypothetical protein IT427_04860 [Pirellulales bacterium]|nr:hypothetical protein [Pirellulales bacterium]
MSKNKKHLSRQPADEVPAETQAADALTIGWMLAVMTTLICQVGALAVRWIAVANPGLTRLDNFSGMLFFVAMIVGVLALVLIPVLYRIRIVSPPRAIVVFAVVVSIAPWVTLIVQWLR